METGLHPWQHVEGQQTLTAIKVTKCLQLTCNEAESYQQPNTHFPLPLPLYPSPSSLFYSQHRFQFDAFEACKFLISLNFVRSAADQSRDEMTERSLGV